MNKENAVEETLAPEGTEEIETTEEEAESGEVAESTEQSEEVKKPKKLGGYQRKVLKLEAELQSLREQVSKPKETAPVAVDKEPREDDFSSPTEYYKALAKFEADVKVKALKEELKEERTKETVNQELKSKQAAYNAKLSEYVKETPDFHEALQEDADENGPMQFSGVVNELLLDSDVAPALIYKFAKDRELLEKLNAMTPTQAARELFRLESGLVKTKPQTKTTTSAPKPITPIKGKTSTTANKDPFEEGIDYPEFERRMRAQESAQKRA